MKDVIKIKLLLMFLLLCVSSVHAAPSLAGIDGKLADDWNGFVAEKDTHGTVGQDFDVEKIGVFIDDTNLYVGLQTGFNLITGEGSIYGGDIALDFGSDGSYEFAFNYGFDTGHNVTAKLYKVSDWRKVNGDPLSMETGDLLKNAVVDVEYGYHETTEGYWGWWGGYSTKTHEHHTLEAAIDYSLLTAQLGSLGETYDVTVFWTMSCGNDSLSNKFTYTSAGIDPVPEPGTFLLFGFGLLGLSMYGRKKI